MHRGGGAKVRMLSFHLCVHAKPMWLTNDLTWSGLNHIMIATGCACCAWPVHSLVVLYYVILPDVPAIVHHIMGCMTFSTFSFPTWEGQLWLTYVPLVVPMDHGLEGSVTSLGIACTKMSSNHCDAFLVFSCKHSSEVIVVPHVCFEFHMMILPVFITHMV